MVGLNAYFGPARGAAGASAPVPSSGRRRLHQEAGGRYHAEGDKPVSEGGCVCMYELVCVVFVCACVFVGVGVWNRGAWDQRRTEGAGDVQLAGAYVAPIPPATTHPTPHTNPPPPSPAPPPAPAPAAPPPPARPGRGAGAGRTAIPCSWFFWPGSAGDPYGKPSQNGAAGTYNHLIDAVLDVNATRVM